MTNLKLSDDAPRWLRQDVLRRLLSCAGMLNVHGFLTDRERKRVQDRLVKWIDEQERKES